MKPLRLQNKAGRIAIQFSVGGQRYSLYGLGNWESHSDKQKAEALMRIVESDILEGKFDATLERYKQGLSKATKALGTPIEMFAQWMEHVNPSDGNYRIHYEPVLKVLMAMQTNQFQPIYSVEAWSGLASRTYNDRVGTLKRFGEWLVSEAYLPANPYRKLKNKPNQTRKIEPLTADEVGKLLSWIAEKNPMAGSYYRFLFLTGCRPAEAIGLLKSKLDMVNGTVTIDSALARDSEGRASGNRRVRKPTKTGDTRVLPLTVVLSLCIVRALGYQQDDCIESDLVFCNQKGEPLDDTNLSDRYWKPALKACGLKYRKPYTTRHTAASTVIENGGTLADAAKLLGHRDLRMVSTTYGHAVKPVQLPSYEGDSEET